MPTHRVMAPDAVFPSLQTTMEDIQRLKQAYTLLMHLWIEIRHTRETQDPKELDDSLTIRCQIWEEVFKFFEDIETRAYGKKKD